MRMPVFSYFTVMGTVLTLALLLVSSFNGPSSSPIDAFQSLGSQKPFKPEPERSPYKITASNFAAEYRPMPEDHVRGVPRDTRAMGSSAKDKSNLTTEVRVGSTWNRVLENPYNELLSVH
jgi:hypothetical protein